MNHSLTCFVHFIVIAAIAHHSNVLARQARIYEEIFQPVQLNPVHFLRLMDTAERRLMLKGNDLIQEGRPHEEVFLIVEGTAEVMGEGAAGNSRGYIGVRDVNWKIHLQEHGNLNTKHKNIQRLHCVLSFCSFVDV